MTQTISRLYNSRSDAEAAAEELKSSGFSEDVINVVAPAHPAATGVEPGEPEPVAETADDGIVASIQQGGVPAAHASLYAEGVRRGETLVSIAPPFGFASRAIVILDKHNPTEIELPELPDERPPHDPAAPLSASLGWRVLIDNPTPLSSFLGLATLSTRRSPPKPDTELVDNPAPLSRRAGWQVLSDNPTPLSTRAGWRVLLDNPTPLSTRAGWRVLSDSQTPKSKSMGLPVLSNNPAPLSSSLGWKLLSDNPAPLSRRMGWRVLSSDPGAGSSWLSRLMS